MPLEHELDLELKRLIVGTNDQRRRVGQAFHHLYRTLVFWRDKGLSFRDVTRAWSAAGAMIFDALATTLRELGEPARDEPLRRFTSVVLARLGDDLERGDHMLVPFLRWLEARFPEITAMMQAADAETPVYDLDLAEVLSATFARCAREGGDGLGRVLGAAARDLRD